MTQISREYILRLQKKQKGKTTVSNNGGGGGGGGASQAWVDANYIGKDFLAQAFTMSKNGVVVTPNDTDTGIDNVNVLVAATMAGAVTMGSTLSVTGATTMTGAVTMGSTLAVDGSITMGTKLVATQEWTDNNYVSIGYFSRLFKAYNGNTAVNPNDLTTTIDNIKAMFGFWTDFYISALGNGGQASSAIYLSGLADVDVTGVQNGQALVWNSTLAKWVPGTGGGGADMNTVWAALAASTSEQINASHLATALSGYAKTYTSTGSSALNALQNAFSLVPKDIATSVLLQYGAASMAIGWYLSGYGYSEAYGGWFVSNYGAFPTWIGVSNGTWYTCEFITSFNIGSQSVNYATSAGSATHATSADSATTATSATSATNANYATSAGSATTATSATNADYATSAGSATTAGSASRLTGDTSYTAWGQSFWSYGTPNNVSGDMTNVGDICLNSSKRIYGTSDIYIGDSNNSNWVKCEDLCSSQGSSVWNIRRGGDATFANMLSNGYVTALSDIRQKDVIKDFALDVHAIANARMIKFTWKDKRDELVHVGGVAQEWQTILPESVTETEDGSLAMDYGVIALMSAISLARVTVNHEQRIAQLENEIRRLKLLIKTT